jgi:hypothetical protein
MRPYSPRFIPLPSRHDLLPVPPTTPTRPKLIYVHPPRPLAKVIPSFRARRAVLALMALTIISLFTITHSFLSPVNSPSSQPSPKFNQVRLHTNHSLKLDKRKQIPLTVAEELAAIVQFISVHPSNALPLSVETQSPIDPQLVCGFDTRSERARREVDEMVSDVWTRNPIVLFREVVFLSNYIPHSHAHELLRHTLH